MRLALFALFLLLTGCESGPALHDVTEPVCGTWRADDPKGRYGVVLTLKPDHTGQWQKTQRRAGTMAPLGSPTTYFWTCRAQGDKAVISFSNQRLGSPGNSGEWVFFLGKVTPDFKTLTIDVAAAQRTETLRFQHQP